MSDNKLFKTANFHLTPSIASNQKSILKKKKDTINELVRTFHKKSISTYTPSKKKNEKNKDDLLSARPSNKEKIYNLKGFLDFQPQEEKKLEEIFKEDEQFVFNSYAELDKWKNALEKTKGNFLRYFSKNLQS